MNRNEAIAKLKELCPAGATVYTVLRHVSRSGMARRISAVVIKDGEPVELDWLINAAGIFKSGKSDGLVVGGCGMDMGFHLVHMLDLTLYPGGGALNQRWL
jgi:hypothetical protein